MNRISNLFPHINPDFIVDDNMGIQFDGYYKGEKRIKTYDVKTKCESQKNFTKLVG